MVSGTMRYRFEDIAYQNSAFEDNILVCCPDCHHPATVLGGTKLTCRNCGFNASGPGCNAFSEAGTSMMDGKRPWFGLYVALADPLHGACTRCGRSLPPIKKRVQQDRLSVRTLPRTCSGCKLEQDVAVTWRPMLGGAEARDPYFGAPLYLTRDLEPGTIYAYNQEHAALMLDYICADLRERGATQAIFKSLFTVLPAWIKSGKNRSSVKRALKSMIDSASRYSRTLGFPPH